MIGFHHSLDEVGGMMPEVSVWLKGMVNADELEGRIFYKGQQIVSTKDGNGSGVSDYDERTTAVCTCLSLQTISGSVGSFNGEISVLTTTEHLTATIIRKLIMQTKIRANIQ